MSLKNILDDFAATVGYGDLSENADQRSVALRYINEAGEEIYEMTDLPGCDQEITVTVNSDTEIAVPSFIGEPRALREYFPGSDWSLKKQIYTRRPRYMENQWTEKWNNWIDKGTSPIQCSITNIAPLTFSINTADDAVFRISGTTTTAYSVEEVVTMSATSVNTTKSFTHIEAITKDAVNSYDVTITDAEDNTLAVIPNNLLYSRYRIFDVSKYPNWQGNELDRYVDVLFKRPFVPMTKNSDCFPVDGFDLIILRKAIQLWTEDAPGQEQRAILMDAKITRRVGNKIADKEHGKEANIQFERSGFSMTREYINFSDGSYYVDSK